MEVEHYIDGQHNGGVYSSFNHNTYMYCLQNPVIYIDPNGKQEKSSYSFTKGFFKGLWDAGTAIGGIKSQIETTVHVAKTSYKIITNQQVQKQFVEGVKVIANDPGGSLSKVGNSIVEGIKNNPEAQGQITGALVAGLSDLGIGAATSTAKGARVAGTTLKEVKAINYQKLLKSIDEFDPVKTLYRGTTGSEGGSSILFLTDDVGVAATYVKNGGQIMEYKVSTSGLKTLEYSGELRYNTGIHGATGKVSTEYVFEGSSLVETLNNLAKPKK